MGTSESIYVNDNGLPLTLRDATDDDVPFMISAWMHHVIERWKAFTKREPFFSVARPIDHVRPAVVDQLAASRLLVAVNPEHADQLYGFVAFDEHATHFLYVKPAFRRMGVARALVEAGPTTRVCTALPWWPLPSDWLFRPQQVKLHENHKGPLPPRHHRRAVHGESNPRT